MSMKSKGAMMAFMAMALATTNENNPQRVIFEPKEIKRFETDKTLKGLIPFLYGDVTIWAINKKNADKKARKQGLI